MNRENRLLVTDKPIEFQINRFKFKTSGKITDHFILEEFIELAPI